MERRQNPNLGASPVEQKRKKHLLSGLIKCSCCGSSYTISGKDYYRCAGQKERGTCTNTVSVRKEPIEAATLSILHHHLLTEDHARVFAEEFRREVARVSDATAHTDRAALDRLAVVTREIDNLAANMLTGVLSPTLLQLLGDREAEKAQLEIRLAGQSATPRRATILPHPVLLQRFDEKVGRLREALDNEPVRGEAAEIVATLIEIVTIYPEGEHGVEAEVVARVGDLITFAANENSPHRGSDGGCSVMVVAGTRSRPKHTLAIARA